MAVVPGPKLKTLALALACYGGITAAVAQGQPGPGLVTILETEGTVEAARARAEIWDRAYTNQVLYAGDRLRTLERSRAVLRLAEVGPIRVGELSLLTMPPERKGFSLLRGIVYFFHRGKAAALDIQTPSVSTLIRGTEFNLAVAEDGTTTLTLLDGHVVMTNALGQVELASGEQGIAEPGQPPRKTAVIYTQRVVQWALYYPAILDPDELELEPAVREVLRPSLDAYRAGDLPKAADLYPQDRQPAGAVENVYRAALLLADGNVDRAREIVSPIAGNGTAETQPNRLARALLRLIAAVSSEHFNVTAEPELGSEWLADSYWRQSQFDLEGALRSAQRAVERSPQSGFAWVRLAELEFSFGRWNEAKKALNRGLELSPRHAQAHALQGFLHAGANRISEAVEAFNRAITLDGALGNAWLGRGLCRIRKGQMSEGLEDLEVAAALEPNRALLRSYLGKAFTQTGDHLQAAEELDLARRLDPNDPTAWLYSALLNQQRNLINRAVRDLEKSQELNGNRRLFRSRLLLDQDRAVRGANLANVYLDAGLTDLSVREAARAVSADYANFSAHLFLAQSYHALRDPRQVDLRYETPWLNEYLVAHLLAPVEAGSLSPVVNQQEYSKLFERDRLGLSSITEYRSGGDWFQAAAQFGIFQDTAYAAEVTYRSENGEWPNGDLEQTTVNLRLKHEFTPQDSLYFQAIYYDAEGGDLTRHYSRAQVNPTLRIEEQQEPILLAGYHRQWSPGSHTLFLAGRLQDTARISDGQQQSLLFDRSLTGGIDEVIPVTFDQDYHTKLEIYTAEAQQIWQHAGHTLIAGTRVQAGEFESRSAQSNPVFPGSIPLNFDSQTRSSSDLTRASGYGYYHWRPAEPLLLIGGLSYDWIRFPLNHRFAPVTDREAEEDQLSPKAGLVWTPLSGTTVRAGYARALGGVSFEQSFQLEPSQVAGFNQAFRSIIPESAAGPTTAPSFDMGALSLEQKLGRNTYFALSGEWLESEVNRALGVFEFQPNLALAQTREQLEYRERSVVLSIYQLLADEWSLGMHYRFTRAEMDRRFGDIPATANLVGGFDRAQELEADLHQVNLFALFNHPSGIFGRLDSIWMSQDNGGYSPRLGGDDFWQFNAVAGYRFPRRRAQVSIGLLNITDQDYRLNPLNLTGHLPRDRTLVVNLSFNF